MPLLPKDFYGDYLSSVLLLQIYGQSVEAPQTGKVTVTVIQTDDGKKTKWTRSTRTTVNTSRRQPSRNSQARKKREEGWASEIMKKREQIQRHCQFNFKSPKQTTVTKKKKKKCLDGFSSQFIEPITVPVIVSKGQRKYCHYISLWVRIPALTLS